MVTDDVQETLEVEAIWCLPPGALGAPLAELLLALALLPAQQIQSDQLGHIPATHSLSQPPVHKVFTNADASSSKYTTLWLLMQCVMWYLILLHAACCLDSCSL